MDADAEHELPQERRQLSEESPTSSCELASLLEDESTLLMVFEHLVEHGLQNCRLVCRRWYEACKQFPVELGKIVDIKQLEMFSAFPNATSVSSDSSRYIPAVALFERLSSLNDLTSLSLQCHNAFHKGKVSPSFQSVAHLTDLRIFNS